MVKKIVNDPLDLDMEQVKERLDYNPETGEFIWKIGGNQNMWPGKVAGACNQDGYIRMCPLSRMKKVFAHRLAWRWVYGEWPEDEIDHINNDRSDNRISNLRLATRVQNCIRVSRSRTPKSGYRGVTEHPQKLHKENRWVARAGGKHIGLFNNPEEAHKAVVKYSDKKYKEYSYYNNIQEQN